MRQEEWFARYTNRLWEFHPINDFMWDMDHLGPWIDESEVETLMTQCPDDPERAADIIFDQVIDEMEMRGEVYSPAQSAPKTPVWKIWLEKFLSVVFSRKS